MFLQNFSTIGYHGTSQEASKRIQSENFFSSRGDDHWLGNGVYFFEDGIGSGLENARMWGKVSAWANDSKKNSYQTYSVIKSPLIFKKLWDLSSQEGLSLFEHCRAELRKRGIAPGKATSGREFDNSVIEFSADMLKFDGLRAWFYIKLDALSRKLKVESGIQNATVLCVRDPQGCISLDQLTIAAEGYVNR